jgi:hypothetical protein
MTDILIEGPSLFPSPLVAENSHGSLLIES